MRWLMFLSMLVSSFHVGEATESSEAATAAIWSWAALTGLTSMVRGNG